MSKMKWYQMKIEEVVQKLNTSINTGLSSEEARRRLEVYGPNEIVEKKKFVKLKIFLNQFKSILVVILIFSTIASVIVGEERDAMAIAFIVIMNAILGFIQEYRAEKAIEMLKRLAAPKARVIRDGIEMVIPARELVPGDIIVLRAGDRVPADARLFEAMNLKVDEAILTGESVSVEKSVEPLKDPNLPVSEQKNMVFMGTTVTYGRGKAIVVATGSQTEFGKIAAMVQKEKEARTPLQEKLEHFGRVITAIILVLVAIVFIEEILEGMNLHEAMLTSISLAVSAVPEGLPAVLTITLALGVQRMAKRNAIVRRLASVEALGSATVICTDKTGTITKNEMTVKEVYVNKKIVEVTGVGYEPKGKFLVDGKEINPIGNETFRRLLEAGLLCSDAELIKVKDEWKITGDPTEGALVVLAAKAGLTKKELEVEKPRIGEVPFDSARKRMSTIHKDKNGKFLLYAKGAPEVLVQLCTQAEINGKIVKFDEEFRSEVLRVAARMAEKALRVLAIAYKPLEKLPEKISEDIECDLTFLGLVGMIDPPRPEVKDAIKKAKQAGVKVIMVTGDHKETAIAIAREIGLIEENEEPLVLTGRDLEELSDEELKQIADKVVVYARVAPHHKLRIVKALKEKGHIVAMTGDGINDAPSIKRADVGIAMGIRGADVTKEVADLILADDNFATIVAAIEEGRAIYDNVRKFLRLLLSANWDEITVVFLSAMLDLPIPFTPAQILWINLLTDGLPALALGVDPPDTDIMKRPPRDPKEKIYHGMELFIIFSMILATFSWIAPFWLSLKVLGRPIEEARTIAFTQAVIFELILALNCRSEREYVFASKKRLLRNKYLLLAIIASLLLQVTVVYLPILNILFDTVPLAFDDWLYAFLFGSLSIILFPGLFYRNKKQQ